MSRQRTCDLLFTRILYLLSHIGLLYVLGEGFLSLARQFQSYDDSIRALLYDQQLECTNITLVIDHLLVEKYETARQLLMHLTYLTAIFVAMVIMLSRNFALILAYTLFFTAVLAGNLLVPIVTPTISLVVFISSTVLGITYICVYLCAPKQSLAPVQKKRKRRATTGRNPPQVPPFPEDV